MKRPVDSKIHGIRIMLVAIPLLGMTFLFARCEREKDKGILDLQVLWIMWMERKQPNPLCADDSLSILLTNSVPVSNTVNQQYRYIQGSNGSQVTFTANDPTCNIGGSIEFCDSEGQLKFGWESPSVSCTSNNPVINGTPRICTATMSAGTRVLVDIGPSGSYQPCNYTIEFKQL